MPPDRLADVPYDCLVDKGPELISELGAGAPPHKHGLSSKKMALTTSDCGTTRSRRIKWP